MRFRMLGPLEAVDGDQLVVLGGIRQRATLGFLLLHVNRVVSSSQLVNALWSIDNPPSSARKILQNAVWRLRGALSARGETSGSVALLSQAPGYMLRAEPEQADLYEFQRLVEEGRADLAAGSPETATQLLQDALALWRGPALADLVETGIDWPELTAVQNARLDAMEDHFEAELACGRHHEMLAELETMVATEPLRERLCGQLMLALYRCGRQTCALDTYINVRTALVDGRGLEPGRALEELQHAILTHDPELVPAGIRQQVDLRMTGMRRGHVDEIPRETAAERKDVSVLIVRTQVSSECDPEKIDEAVESTATTIRDAVEGFGGTVTASIGSVWLALFSVPQGREDDAGRAVRAALTIRDRLSISAAVHIAVATGEALVRYQFGSSPSVNGALLDECHSLLSTTPAGEIRVCGNTRESTESAITYHRGDSSGGWQVGGFRHEHNALHAVPVIDREYELEVLRDLLQRTRHRATPHMVTVLGEPGIGKTRFVTEFERRVAANPDVVRVLVGRVQPGDHPLTVLRDVLSSHRGILPGDAEKDRRRLLSCLDPLIAPDACASRVSVHEVLAVCRHLLSEIASGGPLLVIIEDLHCADDVLVDFVENLTTSVGSVSLLVIVTARSELFERRPMWGGGIQHSLTITLELISDAAIDRLADLLLSTMGPMLAEIGEHPDVRRDYVRRVLASGSTSWGPLTP